MNAPLRLADPERERVSLSLLALPALSLALAMTTVSALVPLTLRQLTTSSLLIGLVVSGEGLMALILPLWVGSLSDRTRSFLGGRLPYVILGTLLCASSLIALPFAASIVAIAALMLVFYVGYFVYYPAYRALYPEIVPRARFSHSQGIQTLFREIGLTLALTASPILFSLWVPLPFMACAVVLVVICAVFVLELYKHARPFEHVPAGGRVAQPWPSSRARRALLANALWEFALSSMKCFVVLYVVVGTGRSPAVASGLMACVALVAVAAAPIAGRLGDRFGAVRVVRVALYIYAIGSFLPCLTQSMYVLLPAMPLVGFGGAIVMTLPYALISEALGGRSHGTSAGWYEFSRGLGAIAGPVVTGAAIDVLEPLFRSTQGYAAMWLVQAIALVLSLPLLPAAQSVAAPARPG